jgi:hypothetical protein
MMRSARLALALLLASARAVAQDSSAPVPLPAYNEALDRICLDLEAGRLSDARGEATALRGAKVEWTGETLDVDATVLDAVTAARSPSDARRLASRVRRAGDALRSARGLAPAERRPRPELLASLAPKDDLVRGGEVRQVTLQPPTVSERIGTALLAAFDWIAEGLEKIGRWIAKFRPRSSSAVADMGSTSTVSILVVSFAALLLALLALRALRKGGGDAEIVSAAVVSSARDEDPLSRETGEWERHARELAAAGRGREAIRAWYHAVLVALFRSGTLHYQKGRTNWEYVSRLGPDLGWRPSFIAMTRLFDREWYGRRGAGPEALRECAQTARAILGALRGGEAA